MSKQLTEYQFPDDLKTMTEEELALLPYAIRDFLIEKVAQNGGHLASNLGVVELSIALHRVFESPRDKIIWDVGHQSYVHKILTGRSKDFDSLRKMDGLSGFPKGKESEHDIFDTGHSTTSISVAAGMAVARDLQKENHEVIAVIGDGSLTGGMAYEAMNNLGASHTKVIVILNDNGMSISQNIGGVSQHLSELRTSEEYRHAKKTIKNALKHIPIIGKGLSSGIGYAKDRLKYALISGGIIFEELGFTYLGPVDGHNLHELTKTLEYAKSADGPILIHVMTKKGKGYRIAEANPDKFHGIGPFDPETGQTLQPPETTYSKVFGDTLVEMAKEDERIVAISAAMCGATGLGDFAAAFPKRFFDVGIAEAHGVTFAAGLAKAGMRPVVAIYSSFLQRAYDQIIEDVCLQKLPVIFAIDRAGIVGADGETHHGLFDLSYLTSIPGLTVLTPASGNQLSACLNYAMTLNSPVAIRYPRGGCHDNPEEAATFDGKNKRIAEGRDIDLWAVGKMRATAVEVRRLLADFGIDAGIVEVSVVKSPDPSSVYAEVGQKNLPVATLEDNLLCGGFGEHFAANSGIADVTRFGWPDRFIEHGDCDSLYKKYGLDPVSIAERIREHLERKA